jgi:hypothetical protein
VTNPVASILTSVPADLSGRRSRGGYRYQDLCALRYCIKIARESSWEEVWCESHDDIVLYRREPGRDRYRFIQVKFKFSAPQHWSCAQLSPVETRGSQESLTDCILVKLFEQDRFEGDSDFRLAVNEGVSDELQPFSYRWNRDEPSIDLTWPGAESLLTRLRNWKPSSGKSIADYVQRLAIERHAADDDDMEAALMMELGDLLHDRGSVPLLDELAATLRELYGLVYRAATADLDRPGHPERITRDTFLKAAMESAHLANGRTNQAARSLQSGLIEKELAAIGLTEIFVKNAVELRRAYYSTWRQNAGTEVGNVLNEALRDVQAICGTEMVRATEDQEKTGRPLLQVILDRLDAHHDNSDLGQRGVSLGLLHGMFYFLLARGSVRLYP